MTGHKTSEALEYQGMKFGRYEVVKRLAIGGMAEIFLAKDTAVKGVTRLVVLKCILPAASSDPSFVELFLDEIRVAARLAHQNIAHVYDFGEVGGQYFIAMEYIDGAHVSHLVRGCYPEMMPVEHAIKIASLVCNALHYAHNLIDEDGTPLGIIHRDVSPENIMVSRNGQVKLVDFGVARAADQIHQTQVGVLRGKMAYLSPEQCSAKPFDHRADIFSLGIVLHEMLCGQRLFKRDNDFRSMQAVCAGPIPSPSQIRPKVPRKLDHIVHKALARDPSERYQQADELSIDLEQVLHEEGLLSNQNLLGQFVRSHIEKVAGDKGRVSSSIRPISVSPQDIESVKSKEISSPGSVSKQRKINPFDPTAPDVALSDPSMSLGLGIDTDGENLYEDARDLSTIVQPSKNKRNKPSSRPSETKQIRPASAKPSKPFYAPHPEQSATRDSSPSDSKGVIFRNRGSQARNDRRKHQNEIDYDELRETPTFDEEELEGVAALAQQFADEFGHEAELGNTVDFLSNVKNKDRSGTVKIPEERPIREASHTRKIPAGADDSGGFVVAPERNKEGSPVPSTVSEDDGTLPFNTDATRQKPSQSPFPGMENLAFDESFDFDSADTNVWKSENREEGAQNKASQSVKAGRSNRIQTYAIVFGGSLLMATLITAFLLYFFAGHQAEQEGETSHVDRQSESQFLSPTENSDRGPDLVQPASALPLSVGPDPDREGSIVLNSAHRDTVIVGGKIIPHEQTQNGIKLKSGSHLIRILRPLHHPWTREVQLGAGQQIQLLAEPQRAGRPWGRLTVESTIKSKVYIAGSLMGYTPIIDLVLWPGPHDVTFVADGNRITKRNVAVPLGKTKSIKVGLESFRVSDGNAVEEAKVLPPPENIEEVPEKSKGIVIAELMCRAQTCFKSGNPDCCLNTLSNAGDSSNVVAIRIRCLEASGQLDKACRLARTTRRCRSCSSFYRAKCED